MPVFGDSQVFNLEKGSIPGNSLVQIPAFIDVHPVFHSSCNLELGIALQSLQGKIDLIYACPGLG